MSINIYSRNFQPSDKKALLTYLQKAYPDRKDLESYVDFTLFRTPKTEEEKSLLIFKDEEIIGANMFLQTHARIGTSEFPIVWSYDTKVLDEYRGTDAGTILCGEAFFIKNSFGAGLSEISKKINTRIHTHFIAKSIAFIKLNVHLVRNLFTFKNRCVEDSRFPEQINTCLGVFSRLNRAEELHQPKGGYWNENVVEFERSTVFLHWRFFSSYRKYQVYACKLGDRKRNDIYFVCRQYLLYGISVLYVVDYRFDITNTAEQDAIIEAAEKLAAKLKFAGVYIRSSLPFFSERLKKHFFLRKKDGADIVTRFKPALGFEGRVFHTSADSDMDFK